MKERLNLSVDPRETSILSEVLSLYESFSADGLESQEAQIRMLEIGMLLIPHVKSLHSPLSIGEFLKIDSEAKIRKGQFWCYDIRTVNNTIKGVSYHVEKTDVWNGSGVQVGVCVYKRQKPLFGVFLQKHDLSYAVVALNSKNNVIRKFSTSRWGKHTWKKA